MKKDWIEYMIATSLLKRLLILSITNRFRFKRKIPSTKVVAYRDFTFVVIFDVLRGSVSVSWYQEFAILKVQNKSSSQNFSFLIWKLGFEN